MSANVTYEGTLPSDSTMSEKHFQCDIHIANYLMAIAVGDIEVKQQGPRTYVLTEPS